MGSFKINFADVESSFEPMPEGNYECVVDRVEVRESRSSDNNYLNWELEVTDEEFETRRLWMITSLSEKALFRLKDVFMALDVIDEDEEIELEWDDAVEVTPGEGPLVTVPALDGLPCVAVVVNEVYEGKERNKVDTIVAGDSAPAKKSPAKAKSGKAPAKKSRKRNLR